MVLVRLPKLWNKSVTIRYKKIIVPGYLSGTTIHGRNLFNLEVNFVLSSSLTFRNNDEKFNMKLKIYLQEAYNELVHKVTWPTWKELQNSALVVMVASFIISLLIFVMDLGFRNIMDFTYGLFY